MARKKKINEDESNTENLPNRSESDDTFGLPEIEYQPINREAEVVEPIVETQSSEPVVERKEYSYQQQTEQVPESSFDLEDDPAPIWPKILGILLVIVLALGTGWYFMMYKPAQAEKARIEKEKLEQEERSKEQARLADQLLRDAEQRKADSLANISKVGVIEMLSARTKQYYVVVASAVDDDLLMDYAKKLSGKGVSTKIIPPFGKHKFFRLTVAEGDTFASAQEVADTKKPEYGDALWVLRY